MKKVKFYVPESMYSEIESLKKQGVDINQLIEESLIELLQEFKDNPKEALKKFNEYENKYQVENKIN